MICAAYNELWIPNKLKNSNWEKALAWLRAESWKNLPIGKTEIDGPGFYVLRSSYMSKPISECRWESHRRYADIQMVIKGSEICGVCARDGLEIAEAYSDEKDIEFLRGESDKAHDVILGFPLAAALFPWDVHMPSVALDGKPSQIEKVVLKIAL